MAPSIEFEPYEELAVETLLLSIKPNTPSDGMAPDHMKPLCLRPEPEIPPPLGGVQDIDTTLRLVSSWECAIFHLNECRLWDGTDSSAQAFEEATGLTPMRFAQAWLEAPGGLWRYFHYDYNNPVIRPGDAAVGPQMFAIYMVEFWALKIKHWRTVSEAEAKEKMKPRVGGPDCVAETMRAVNSWLPEVIPVDGKDHEEFMLIRALRTIGSWECRVHAERLCNCEAAINTPVSFDMGKKRTAFING